MAVMSKRPENSWPASAAEIAVPRRRRRRKASRFLRLMHIPAAMAAGILVARCAALNSALGVVCVLMAAAALPLLGARLLKNRLCRRTEEPLRSQAAFEYRADEAGPVDHFPTALLILSSDLRVCFANRACFDATLQTPQEILGRRLEDVLPAEGLEEQAEALLIRSHNATISSFVSFPGGPPAERRPVSVTMTRIPPVDGEDRILVLVEDILEALPSFQSPVVDGYIC